MMTNSRVQYLKEYRKRNKTRINATTRAYRKRNPKLVTKYSILRQLRLIQATPKWVDLGAIYEIHMQCTQFYEQTGVRYVVDHIVPLNGRNVCGLHVPWNLQIITKEENLKKGNSHG
jgi:5-methylcytosine-specific restriction endonuclease McrA